MLPATLRMRRAEDYRMTIRRGVRARAGVLVLHGRGVPGREAPRVGFVVPGAVGGAVVRNRVRRRLRGLVVEHRGSLPSGSDVVVRVLPEAADAGYDELGSDLTSALAALARRLGEG